MDIVLKNVKKKDLPVIKSLAKALGFEIDKAEEKTEKPLNKGFDAKAFLGKVKLDKDPLAIQKEMRDEWE